MTDIKYLIVAFLIYSLLDVVSFCMQSERISELERELRKIKERNEGADNDK